MNTDQTITVTVKPEIDREAVEEAARAAAALFLSSFAVAVLEGIAAEEPPEEVLERVKAETLEKAAQGHECDSGNFDRTLCAPPCGSMHSFCTTCGQRQDPCAHDQNPAQDGEDAPLAGAEHDQASYTGGTAADAPEPAQTLADLEPCLGDRVRVGNSRMSAAAFGWLGTDRGYGWRVTDSQWRINSPESWTVLEHLPPVTPEEPPVGAGMLVDREGDLWRRDEGGWWLHEKGIGWWLGENDWSHARSFGPLRPATPADLAEHGVDEQGEPVGREAVTAASVLHETADWLESMMPREGGVGGPQSGYGRAGLDIIRLIRERAAKDGAQ